jgi:hypothetical protein
MRAFVCEIDHHGLRWLLPEDLLPTEELARIPSHRPATVAWALLDESAAEALLEDVRAGRHREACGSLINHALDLVSLGTVAPDMPPCRLPLE